MKLMICLGTRPEIIKMSTIIKELRRSKYVECVVCLSGQHKELAENAAKELGISIDYNLNIMKKNQSLQYILGSIVEKLADLIRYEKPNYVVVHGDTSTCFASSLCSFYERIPIIYIEAGWRSHDIGIPFPEEMHRQMVSKIAKYFICSTADNYNNLVSEGINKKNIFITGNSIIDVLKQTITADYVFSDKTINDNLSDHQIILITFHRRENREKICDFFDIISKVAQEKKQLLFLWIAHPSLMDMLNSLCVNIQNIRVVRPISVYDMHNLIYRASVILTDSAGIQEETHILKKNTIILRENIERTELLDDFSVLVEINLFSIKNYIEYFLHKEGSLDIKNLPEENIGIKISEIIQEVICEKTVNKHFD